mmetsp:Transcript_111253/g.315629  ORF Transcript_111253/g.315629 Transcript_111253/m.315629 type:complete len:443 (-) Transcript_111253:1853-3181(-)
MRCDRPESSATLREPPSWSTSSSMAFGGSVRARMCSSSSSFSRTAHGRSWPSSPWVSSWDFTKCSRTICGPDRCSGITGSWKARCWPGFSLERIACTLTLPTGRPLMVFTCHCSSSARLNESEPPGSSSTLPTMTRSPRESSRSSNVTFPPLPGSTASTVRCLVACARNTSSTGTDAPGRSSTRASFWPCTEKSALPLSIRVPLIVTSFLRRVRAFRCSFSFSSTARSATRTRTRPPSLMPSMRTRPTVSSFIFSSFCLDRASPVAQIEITTCSPLATASRATAAHAGTLKELSVALKKRCCAPQNACHTRRPSSSDSVVLLFLNFHLAAYAFFSCLLSVNFWYTVKRRCQNSHAALYCLVCSAVNPLTCVSNCVPVYPSARQESAPMDFMLIANISIAATPFLTMAWPKSWKLSNAEPGPHAPSRLMYPRCSTSVAAVAET